jgi:sialic acid synthase SpsE
MFEKFILDFGSGNTCKNDANIVQEMIESLRDVIDRRRLDRKAFTIKWQLFEKAGDNVPLSPNVFKRAVRIAEDLGLETTASVFDVSSIRVLFDCVEDVPFVKVANRPDLWPLIEKLPIDVRVIVSVPNDILINLTGREVNFMRCVSSYPAKARDYRKTFSDNGLRDGISDHTTTWALLKYYAPRVYECHYRLENSTGLDAGPFARTPKQLLGLFNV